MRRRRAAVVASAGAGRRVRRDRVEACLRGRARLAAGVVPAVTKSAIEALFAYADRYATVVEDRDRFAPPSASRRSASRGCRATRPPTSARRASRRTRTAGRSMRRWLTRQTKLLRATWDAFDRAVDGVGRALAKAARRSAAGWDRRPRGRRRGELREDDRRSRRGLRGPRPEAAAAREEERAPRRRGPRTRPHRRDPARGPRGGARWTAVLRAASRGTSSITRGRWGSVLNAGRETGERERGYAGEVGFRRGACARTR